jgi:hypothetical protein
MEHGGSLHLVSCRLLNTVLIVLKYNVCVCYNVTCVSCVRCVRWSVCRNELLCQQPVYQRWNVFQWSARLHVCVSHWVRGAALSGVPVDLYVPDLLQRGYMFWQPIHLHVCTWLWRWALLIDRLID